MIMLYTCPLPQSSNDNVVYMPLPQSSNGNIVYMPLPQSSNGKPSLFFPKLTLQLSNFL